MKSKVFHTTKIILTNIVILITGLTTIYGQQDFQGLSIYSPSYYQWNTIDAIVTTYDLNRFIIPETTSPFTDWGTSPEGAAKAYWSALTPTDYDRVTLSADTLLQYPDFEGLKEFYTYNVKYQLINNIELQLQSGAYCYIQYSVSSDIKPEGIEGVMILKKKDGRWYCYTEDPLMGFSLVMVYTRPKQLEKIFKGDFKNDPRFEKVYKKGDLPINMTNLIRVFKTWFNDDGEILSNMTDILKHPNWRK